MVRQVGRAESEIPERQECGEVLVDALLVRRVMPVVILRRRDRPTQSTETPAQVGVDEHRVKRQEHQVGEERRWREADDEHRQVGHGARQDGVHRMDARAGEPVHFPARVMDGVEAPQPRHPVKRAVDPVGGEIDEQHDLDELQPQRLGGHRLLKIEPHRPGEQHLDRNQRRERQQLHPGVADEEMLQVGLPAFAEHALRAQRKHALERHEDESQHQQLKHEVVQPGRKRARRDDVERLDLGAAHQQRDDAQQDPEQAAAVGSHQRHAEHAERDAEDDARVQDAAEHPEMRRVQRQRVARHQQVGQQEAQLREHAQHAEHARREPGALADGCAQLRAHRRACRGAARGASRMRRVMRSPCRWRKGQGFEPSKACALPVFKTGAFDHSATLPGRRFCRSLTLRCTKRE